MGSMEFGGMTADGIEIMDGLRVWTNNLELATVTINDRFKPWREVFQNPEDSRFGQVEWWFYVTLDSGGNQIMSESRVSTRHPDGRKAV
jgi:hypothetical protein